MTMSNYETKILLALTMASLATLSVSLWMAWSVWREVRRLVAQVGNHMEGLMRKQTEVMQEVAHNSTGAVHLKPKSQPIETEPGK
jgi:hypothetical protein